MPTLEPYFTLPGTAGNYLSTPDVNLLDADSAHCHQSKGQWGAVSVSQSTALSPVFGDFHFSCSIPSGTNVTNLYQSPAGTPTTTGIAISGSTAYAFSLYAAMEDATACQLEVRVNQYNSGGSLLAQTIVDAKATITDGFVEYGGSFTSEATAAYAIPRLVLWGVDGAGTEKFYWDAVCFRIGSTATFVPSLRIVGDLDLRARVACDLTPSADMAVISKDGASGRSYKLLMDNSGTIQVVHWSGTTAEQQFSEALSGYGYADGEWIDVRATVDVSTGGASFYADGAPVGTDTGITGAVDVGDAPIEVGRTNRFGAELFAGDIEWAEVRDGIDGPVVARVDPTDVVL